METEKDDKKVLFYMVGNTHFDPVWLWKWDEAMASIRATFRSALDRMKEDEGFIYSFATPPVFEWIKDTDPEMFEEIRMRIAEGRWELAEGWWLQPDTYSLSGESCVRQGLYGQRYLMENFGKYAETVFNIDSFGHSPMLPQILAKSGIKYYCFVRPEEHHLELKKPYFKWLSPDGSSVLVYRAKRAYQPDVCQTAEFLKTDDGDNVMIVYGVSDHGGAPTKRSIADINRSADMKFSTVSDFFRETGDTAYTVSDELLTGDFGPYVNGNEVKKLNAYAEYALLNAEKSAVIAERDSQNTLTQCWKDVLFGQFHDILGGACIRAAYFDVRNLLGKAVSRCEYITHTNLQRVTAQITMPGKNPDNAWNLVVWNLNACVYDDYIEAEVQWALEFDWYNGPITLEDGDGRTYPCQIIRERSVVPRFRSRFVFKAQIPPMGYKAFKVICGGENAEIVNNPDTDPHIITTDLYRYEVNRYDASLTVYDRVSGNIIASDMLLPVCYRDDGDTWCFNIKDYGEELGRFQPESFTVTEDGIHRVKIKVLSRFGNSSLTTYYVFYKKEHYFDVSYRLNWNESHTVFKFEMPKSGRVTAGVPAGRVTREDRCGDVPVNKWLSCDNYSVISDSIFGYRAQGSKLGLTVVRSPIYGDLRINDIDLENDYEIMEQGITEGRLRVLFETEVEGKADAFCNGVTVIDESNHGGTLPQTGSYAWLTGNGVTLSALKYSEAGDGIIARIREYSGNAEHCTLTLRGKSYGLDMKPYEIKTIRIADDTLYEVNMLEEPQHSPN